MEKKSDETTTKPRNILKREKKKHMGFPKDIQKSVLLSFYDFQLPIYSNTQTCWPATQSGALRACLLSAAPTCPILRLAAEWE